MFQLLTEMIYTVYYRWKEQNKIRFEKKYNMANILKVKKYKNYNVIYKFM